METEKFFIDGLILLSPKVFADERGYFFESFNAERYREFGIPMDDFVQDNVSSSGRGVLRGLHFQRAPMAQGKLVQVLHGKVLDVAVDIRSDSSTFGKFVAVELSGENHRELWIPAGFAHGFLALEDDTIFSYKVTAPYAKEHEAGIRYDDPDIAIVWPHVEGGLIVSGKDRELPFLKELFNEKINGFTS
jgi:dTDP-4-dehydrorhamnose 3,5-epimerase